MVAKTYIISQALYVMGILPLSDTIASRLNEILVNYIAGTGRPIERRRQLLLAEVRGYGMIDMRVMNVCLKSLWISRLSEAREDLDYMSVVMVGENNIGGRELDYERVEKHLVPGGGGVIIEEILHKWKEFKEEFYRVEDNILIAQIFDNKCVKVENVKIEDFVFGIRFVEVRDVMSNITVGEFLDRGNMIRSKMEIETLQGVRINWAEYFRLRQAIGRLADMRITGIGGIMISEFMNRGKNKCRKL
jgi:hypothetical protein